MVDFAVYRPPGVYVEEELTPLVDLVGPSPTVVGIVGPSIGYRLFTEAVVLNGTATTLLKKLGINPSAVTVTKDDGTPVASSQYALVAGAGEDASLLGLPDNTTTLARTSGSTIVDGSTVIVTYQYSDATFYQPQRFTDYDDVKSFFGQPFNTTTGAILSPLALAAKAAKENGASEVVLLSTTGSSTVTTASELNTGYTKLASYPDVNVIVPLPVGITGTPGSPGEVNTVGSDLKTHLEAMAASSIFRIGVLGMEKTVTVLPEVSAAAFRSKRVVLGYPNKMNYFNGFINQTTEVGGYYLAAAMAGRLATLPTQEPLTKKFIHGFQGIPSSVLGGMTKAYKDQLSDAGVAVVEYGYDQALLCRHGTTTDRSNVYTRELSLVRARDSMVELILRTIERSSLVGSAIDNETMARVKGVLQGCLETAVAARIIISYSGLKVRQSPDDPTVIEVKFQYKPAYPLNYVVISFTISTLTGAADIAA